MYFERFLSFLHMSADVGSYYYTIPRSAGSGRDFIEI